MYWGGWNGCGFQFMGGLLANSSPHGYRNAHEAVKLIKETPAFAAAVAKEKKAEAAKVKAEAKAKAAGAKKAKPEITTAAGGKAPRGRRGSIGEMGRAAFAKATGKAE